MATYNQRQIQDAINHFHGSAVVRCRLLRPMAGGMSADIGGLAQFVEHHLKIDPTSPEFTKTIERIQREEIGEKDVTPEGVEEKELKVYSVKTVRKSELGCWLGSWQIKALIKQVATRNGLTRAVWGTKDDLKEFSTVEAYGLSRKKDDRPFEIYLCTPDGQPAPTKWLEIKGSPKNMQGQRVSIMTHSLVVDEGAIFEYKFRPAQGKLNEQQVLELLGCTQVVGQGSALSMGYGMFAVESITIDMNEPAPKKEKKAKGKKGEKGEDKDDAEASAKA